MKIWKKLLALVCAGTMVLSSVACGNKAGGNKVDNTVEDTKNLNIMVYVKGYGSEWLTATAKAFEEKHEGVTVNITPVNSTQLIQSDLKNWEYSDTDLYFDIASYAVQPLVEEYASSWDGKQAMRDLTYLYNSEIPGEGITLGEKMFDSMKYTAMVEGRSTEDASDDTYYSVPYATTTLGLYYNETVINNALGEGNWEVPNTTDELVALCQQLKAKDVKLLVTGALQSWAGSMFLNWWSQYEGIENYRKFYEGIGYDATRNRETQNSSFIFEQPGRLAALEVCEQLLSQKNGFIPNNAAEIDLNTLIEYQTRFTLSEFNYGLYVSGEYLAQDLANRDVMESDSVIKMMKAPVISSIIESTDSYSGSDEKRLPNITSDEILSQVVDYVDGKGELPAGVTEEEVNIVKEARNTMASKSSIHFAYAPAYSNAKTLADEFLLFMASDEGIEIFKKNTAGGFAPYEHEYNVENLSVTEQSIYETMKDANYVENYYFNPLFYRAGVDGISNGGTETLDILLCKPNGLTAQEIHQSFIDAYSGVKWDNYLSKIK